MLILAPSLSDNRADSEMKKKTRKSLSLASKECYRAVNDTVHNHRFRILDFTRYGSNSASDVLSKLMSQPEQARMVKEMAMKDIKMRKPRTSIMQQIQNHIQRLAVPATLKHELVHNDEYPGCVMKHTILLSISERLEVLWLDSNFFHFGQGLLDIFKEAARPGSAILPRLREVNVNMMKMLPIEHLQAILRLPALKTFDCHGYVCTIQRTRQTTGPRQLVSVHVEQRHDRGYHWLQRLLRACPQLEDLSLMTYTHSDFHNSSEYWTIGHSLREYSQQLLHLKLENRCKTEVDDSCSDKMDALGTLEPLARL